MYPKSELSLEVLRAAEEASRLVAAVPGFAHYMNLDQVLMDIEAKEAVDNVINSSTKSGR